MDVYVAALIVTGSSIVCGMFLVNKSAKLPHS
jgi:hypothetical protein